MRHASLISLVAAVAVLAGCAAQSQSPVTSKAAAVSSRRPASVAQGKPQVPAQAETRLLSDARAQLPTWAMACEPARKTRKTQGLDVRSRQAGVSARNFPHALDPGKPVLQQLVIPAPDWWDGYAFVDITDSHGAVVGWMGLRWTKGSWNADAFSVADSRWDRDHEKGLTRALADLSRALGGTLEETATVGDWVLARRGVREGGVLLESQDMVAAPPPSEVGRVYTDEAFSRKFLGR